MQEKIMVIDCQRDVDYENAVNELDIIQFIVFDKSKDFYICNTLTNAEKLAKEIGGTIYFYHTTMVSNIIADIDNDIWDIISLADNETYDLDNNIRRNAKKRLRYHLNKLGLTLVDWDIWCTL
jgi:hypothetical protein